MPALYIENIPQATYDALRRHARDRHRSIAAIVVSLLEECIPTQGELLERQKLFSLLVKRSRTARSRARYPASEDLQRQDRAR
jgi:hypothetical protein